MPTALPGRGSTLHPALRAELRMSSSWFSSALTSLIARRDLTEAEMRAAMEEMVSGRCSDTETAAFLVALRMKGESAMEIATAAAVLRERMVCLDTGRDG